MHEQLNSCGLLAANDSGLSPVHLVIALICLMIALPGMTILLLLLKHYKRCPPNRLLVIWGRTGSGQTSTVIHGGAICLSAAAGLCLPESRTDGRGTVSVR